MDFLKFLIPNWKISIIFTLFVLSFFAIVRTPYFHPCTSVISFNEPGSLILNIPPSYCEFISPIIDLVILPLHIILLINPLFQTANVLLLLILFFVYWYLLAIIINEILKIFTEKKK